MNTRFPDTITTVAVVGLGYVGLPLAVALSRRFAVVGFDVKKERIDELARGVDRTQEVTLEQLQSARVMFTSDPESLKAAQVVIVAVPTPVDEGNVPDLSLVEKASELVGRHMAPQTIVVFESTVYPGVTEEICVPILEKASGLTCGEGFKVGYSPERINPGDKEHTIDRVTKVVAGMDEQSLEVLSTVYGSITTVFKAASIKVAEAAKVIENTQRDLNIALMNELAVIFERMDISIYDVLAAAQTKWNFLPFKPGLVGGHCIGVDPYYLTYRAQMLGYHPEVILAGRKINDAMPHFVIEQVMKRLISMKRDASSLAFTVAGITFKENVPDVRNSKAAVLVQKLKEYGVVPAVFDPVADSAEVHHEYGIAVTEATKLSKADVLIVAVAHDAYKQALQSSIERYAKNGALIVDVKNILDGEALLAQGYHYWKL